MTTPGREPGGIGVGSTGEEIDLAMKQVKSIVNAVSAVNAMKKGAKERQHAPQTASASAPVKTHSPSIPKIDPKTKTSSGMDAKTQQTQEVSEKNTSFVLETRLFLERIFGDEEYKSSGPQQNFKRNFLTFFTVASFALLTLIAVWTLVIFILNCDQLDGDVVLFLERRLELQRLVTASSCLSLIICLVTFAYAIFAAVTTWFLFSKTFKIGLGLGGVCLFFNLIFTFLCAAQLDNAYENTDRGLERAMDNFRVEEENGSDDDHLWNFVQLKWDCCGVDGASDWTSSKWFLTTDTTLTTLTYNVTRRWPSSCCKDTDTPVDISYIERNGVKVNPYTLDACYDPISGSTDYVNTRGCKEHVRQYIESVCATFVAMYFIQFIFITASVIVIVIIKLKREDLKATPLPEFSFMEKSRQTRVSEERDIREPREGAPTTTRRGAWAEKI